jgi:hypothetical protein
MRSLIALAAAIWLIGCAVQTTPPALSHDSAVKIAEAAMKARGIDLSDKVLEDVKDEYGQVVVYYAPRQKPGFDTLGGDVTVRIDAQTGRVTSIVLGQ